MMMAILTSPRRLPWLVLASAALLAVGAGLFLR